MKKIVYLIILSTVMACSSPTSSNSNDDQDPLKPPIQSVEINEDIIISDGTNSITLTFGLQEDLTAGYDSDTDIESPPFNPPGSFFAHFAIPEHNLFKDIRSSKSEAANWRLKLPTGEDQIVELSWDWNIQDLKGTITLQDKLDNPNVVIDMLSEDTFTTDLQSVGSELILVYKNGKNKVGQTVGSIANTSNKGNNVKSKSNALKGTGVGNQNLIDRAKKF